VSRSNVYSRVNFSWVDAVIGRKSEANLYREDEDSLPCRLNADPQQLRTPQYNLTQNVLRFSHRFDRSVSLTVPSVIQIPRIRIISTTD
jgi:hypothetical protein